jgi:hypothetical protein
MSYASTANSVDNQGRPLYEGGITAFLGLVVVRCWSNVGRLLTRRAFPSDRTAAKVVRGRVSALVLANDKGRCRSSVARVNDQ